MNIDIKEKISIVTVSYNCIDEIERTIISVVEQDYPNLEYIVVDGNSNDGTVDLIKKYSTNIDTLICEQDEGIYDAMNKGVEVATGQWVIFMNAGDKFFNSSSVSDVFNNVANLEQTTHIYGKVASDFDGYLLHKKLNKLNDLRLKMPFCHQSVFTKLEYHKLNKFSNRYSIVADFEFFNQSYHSGNIFKKIDRTISVINPGGISDKKKVSSYLEKMDVARNYPLTMYEKFSLYYGFISLLMLAFFKPCVPEFIIKLKRRIQNFLRSFYG